MLGTSETVGDSPELFSLVDRKNKIYAKRNVAASRRSDFGFGVQAPEPAPAIQRRHRAAPGEQPGDLADRKILELYGPPGVVINEELEILHFRGRTGPYLEPTPGAPSFNILRLARPELHVELRRALQQASASNERVGGRDAARPDDGKTRVVPSCEVVAGRRARDQEPLSAGAVPRAAQPEARAAAAAPPPTGDVA